MATTVRVTETYDLKTTINKIGILGIHTPTIDLIKKMYPGLLKNHRFIRFKKCDIVGACASVLPADPLQVGVSSGDVAPEDMFNPILMRAVSNSSFDTLVSRIYNVNAQLTALGSVSATTDVSSSDAINFKIYYSLLAESKRWKKSMPQRGFAMKGLYPICHTVVNSFGNIVGDGVNSKILGVKDGDENTHDIPNELGVNVVNSGLTMDSQDIACQFRGKTVKMPAIPIHSGEEGTYGIPTTQIPKTFVACLVVPPARLHEFYYRMRVSWTVSFEGVAPATEFGDVSAITTVADSSYMKSYTSAKAEMESKTDCVDADGVSVNKIMES